MLNMTDDERDAWLRELYGDEIKRYDNYQRWGHWSECYDIPFMALINLNCLNDKWSGDEKEQWKHDHYVGSSTDTRWGWGSEETEAIDYLED